VEFSLQSHNIYICGPRFRLVTENGVMEVEVKSGSHQLFHLLQHVKSADVMH